MPCSPSWVVGIQQQSISFSAVNIFLSITAFLGNFLILAALNKESYLHPPSKLLYRCLATTDLLVGLVGLVVKLCIMWGVFVDIDSLKHGQTSRSVVRKKIQTNSNFKAHVYDYSYFLDFFRRQDKTSSKVDNPTSSLLSINLDIFSRNR